MWGIKRVGDGVETRWQVEWRGQPFGSSKPSRQEAEDILSRWKVRYPGESAGALLAVTVTKRRGGKQLWRWRTSCGVEPLDGTLVARSEKAARSALRHILGRRRLPSDLVLEPAA